MGQYWHIINADRREVLVLPGVLKLGAFFFSNDWDGLFFRLRIPRLHPEVEEWVSAGNTASQPCLLASVPVEIFHAILQELSDDIHDLAALALTCKVALVSAKPYILEALKAIHATWASRRIICLGDYTYEDDQLPAGFLTEEELNEAKTTTDPRFGSDDEDVQFDRYYHFAVETYHEVFNERKPRFISARDSSMNRWIGTLKTMYTGTYTTVDHHDFGRFISLCGYEVDEAETYPPGEPVLFNLSKGEYVRSAPILALQVTEGPFSLINALLARICWTGTEVDNNAMELDRAQYWELGRGRWAGDRFCITVMEDAPRAPGAREWVDVSEETAEFLFHAWRHARRWDPLCDAKGP